MKFTAALSCCLLAAGMAPAFAAAPAAPALNLSLACPIGNPMWDPSTTHPPVFGVIIKFVSRATAEQHIKLTEAANGGTIDPAYTNNQRVILQSSNGRTWWVLVPTGMVVHLGEGVSFAPGHGDPGNLCLYTPNLIVP